jgi:hypothetical protein
MSGESSGFACAAPLEQREKKRLSNIHCLDMTTPFETRADGTGFRRISPPIYDRIGNRVSKSRACVRIAIEEISA